MSDKNVSAAAAALIPGTPVPIRKPLVDNNSAKVTPTAASMSQNPMSGNKATRMITAQSIQKGSASQIRQPTHFNQQNQPIQGGNSAGVRNNSVSYNMQSQRGTNTKRYNNAATPIAQKRKIENLPRTGIEYPIMKLPTQFISQHRDHEPLTEVKCPQSMIDQYIANDAQRASSTIRKFWLVSY